MYLSFKVTTSTNVVCSLKSEKLQHYGITLAGIAIGDAIYYSHTAMRQIFPSLNVQFFIATFERRARRCTIYRINHVSKPIVRKTQFKINTKFYSWIYRPSDKFMAMLRRKSI